jgi:hypothetical protein
MLTDSQNELNELGNHVSNTAFIIDDPYAYLNDLNKDLNNYKDKVMYAYDSFDPDKDSVLPDEASSPKTLQDLIDDRNGFSDAADILIMSAAGFAGIGILMIIGSMFVASVAPMLTIALTIAGAIIAVIGGVMFGVASVLKGEVNTISDIIHKLFPDYDDSWFKPIIPF